MTNKQELEQAIRGAEEIKKGLLANIEFMSNVIDVMTKLAAKADEPEKKEWRQKPVMVSDYFFIDDGGTIKRTSWFGDKYDNLRYAAGNCFPCSLFTKEEVQQIAWRNQLNSLLTQYAIINGALASEEEKLNINKALWHISTNYDGHTFFARVNHGMYPCSVIFNDCEIAEQAIKDVVEPFLAAHPKFVW